eukprot:scaffold49532_cov75-Phaeocystis_antarctica.AAC.2
MRQNPRARMGPAMHPRVIVTHVGTRSAAARDADSAGKSGANIGRPGQLAYFWAVEATDSCAVRHGRVRRFAYELVVDPVHACLLLERHGCAWKVDTLHSGEYGDGTRVCPQPPFRDERLVERRRAPCARRVVDVVVELIVLDDNLGRTASIRRAGLPFSAADEDVRWAREKTGDTADGGKRERLREAVLAGARVGEPIALPQARTCTHTLLPDVGVSRVDEVEIARGARTESRARGCCRWHENSRLGADSEVDQTGRVEGEKSDGNRPDCSCEAGGAARCDQQDGDEDSRDGHRHGGACAYRVDG